MVKGAGRGAAPSKTAAKAAVVTGPRKFTRLGYGRATRGTCSLREDSGSMRFVLLAWLITRAFIGIALLMTSAHPLASAGNWDGAWYGSIAQHGYGFASRGMQHDLAFFPLYPLLASLLLHAGISWPLAGVLVSNIAFLGALAILYALARGRWNVATARWTVAVTCACPLSLFASVAYHEGTFLFFSALALWWTLRDARFAGGLAGAAASATSALGIALAAALVIDAVVQRRGTRAIASAMLAFGGIGLFALFCALRFGDPLAFAHAEAGWRMGGIDIAAWYRVFQSIIGLWSSNLLVALVPIAAIALVVQRKALGTLLTLYGLLAIALILFAGEPTSADRYAFAVIPVLIAFARALQRVPIAGGAVVLASLALLAYDTVQFARFHWVA